MSNTRYTHGHHASVLRAHSVRTAESSAGYLLPHLRSGMDVLDIGCGPGTITIDLARLVFPGAVVGIDSSETAITAARRRAEDLASAPDSPPVRLTFAVADAYALDLADHCVDVVHAHQVLQHLSEPVAALAEWRRLVRPGGLVAARDADYEAFTWAPPDERLDRWLAWYRDVARRNGGEPDAGRSMLGWAHAAGFTDVAATASVWCFSTPEDRQWWAGTWADRVTASAFAEQLVAEGVASPGDLDDVARAFLKWSEHPDGYWTIPHGEIICRV